MPTSAAEPVAPGLRAAGTRRTVQLVLALGLLGVAVAALGVGRYPVDFDRVVRILLGRLLPIEATWTPTEEAVVLAVRLPRVLLAMLVGAGLAISGATLQAVFCNPVVSPQLLGVSSGASFGGALAIVGGLGSAGLVAGSFCFGLLALVAVFATSRLRGPAPPLTIVLCGIVVGAFFAALVSLLTYLADPGAGRRPSTSAGSTASSMSRWSAVFSCRTGPSEKSRSTCETFDPEVDLRNRLDEGPDRDRSSGRGESQRPAGGVEGDALPLALRRHQPGDRPAPDRADELVIDLQGEDGRASAELDGADRLEPEGRVAAGQRQPDRQVTEVTVRRKRGERVIE